MKKPLRSLMANAQAQHDRLAAQRRPARSGGNVLRLEVSPPAEPLPAPARHPAPPNDPYLAERVDALERELREMRRMFLKQEEA